MVTGTPATTAPPAITRDLFKQHGLACRVYDYEAEYQKLNSAALSKGVTIKDELKQRGFKDFSSFYMACPKFSMLCWPSALGDLGGGVVLYFHFLAFCAGFLFLALLVQLPAMLEYVQADNIVAWNYVESGFDTTDTYNCGCLGSNNGSTGHHLGFSQADYGTRCHTWDLSWCQLGASGPYAQGRGQWCCRSWCYASAKCPNTQAGSESNLEVVGKGIVRSYSACEQPSLSVCTAAGSGMGRDRPFPHDAFREDKAVPRSFMRITGPGNLGPDGGESRMVLWCYFALLLIFCMSVVVAHQYQLRCLEVVDHATTQPNDFAIFVEGLPGTATDEAQIAEFFKENAVVGRKDTEIAKVIIGWESQEYRENMRELRRLQKKLLLAHVASNLRCIGWCISLEPVESVIEKLSQIQEKIRSSAPDMAKRLLSSGVVVVVFRYQNDHRKCLERWASIPSRLFYTDTDGVFGLGKGTPLPRFFHRALRVHRAPNPSDINWEDLGVTRSDRLKMFAKTNGMLLLLIIACFFAIYGLEELKELAEGQGYGWSTLPVLGVTFTNVLLMVACKNFGKQEYHNTLADQTASQSTKMAIAMVLNTVGVMFFKNSQPKEWYKYLVDDVFLLLAVTACLQPAAFLMDSKYYLNWLLKRRDLSDDQIDQWNSVIQSQEKPKTKEEATAIVRQRAQVAKQVEKMKEAFQPSELDTTKRYAVAVRTFLCCLLFSPLMPLITLVGIIGLSIQYWIDKYMLLRWFKRPTEPHPGEQAIWSLVFVRLTTAVFLPLAAFVFIHPSWKEAGACRNWLLMSLAVTFVFCITPLSVQRTLLCLRCIIRKRAAKVADENADNEDYYKAQRLWTKEMKYHKSQFLYKMVPEAKNPEMLQPGAYTATTADDLRGSYGVAAASMAAGASGPAPSVHVRGHGKVDMGSSTADPLVSSVSSTSLASGGGGGGTAGPAPAGDPAASPAAGDDPSLTVQDVSDKPDSPVGDGPAGAADPAAGGAAAADPPAAPAATGGAGSPAVVPVPAKTQQPVWKYEGKKGFYNFDDDCQAYIEKKYQDKLAGGSKRVNVSTNGITISLDFERMSQKAGRNGKIREIKREMQ